ncbi:MAG TPA: SRPBCC family protein [Solirubrobacteraceae bacterium]|nr:SRPBCC family protein [Solirubrobacteraceae bacterium]
MAMPTSGTAVLTTPADEQILITREFDAPRELVFRAYTEPDLVSRWWPGRRGEMKVCEIDLRPGGRWRYAMLAEGGFDVAFHGEYREVVPGERVVFTEIFELPDGTFSEATTNTATFVEAEGRTTLRLLTETSSREVRDMILQSGMEGGVQEGLDILEELAIGLR